MQHHEFASAVLVAGQWIEVMPGTCKRVELLGEAALKWSNRNTGRDTLIVPVGQVQALRTVSLTEAIADWLAEAQTYFPPDAILELVVEVRVVLRDGTDSSKVPWYARHWETQEPLRLAPDGSPWLKKLLVLESCATDFLAELDPPVAYWQIYDHPDYCVAFNAELAVVEDAAT